MRSKKAIGVILLLICALTCLSCAPGQTDAGSTSAAASAATTEPTTISEGVDTPCTVSYSTQTGEPDSHFLSAGDTIAVVAPSSLPSQEQVDATVEGLKQWGYTPVLGKHVREESCTLADCLEDLVWALEDPAVKAVFCVRGGYGASEVMDLLPMELVSTSDKLIIGYSDITVFHSAWTKAQIPSLYASMSAAFMGLPEECVQVEQRMLQGEIPTYTCESNNLCKTGEADGILIGGNLSTFTAVLGTAYDCTQMNQPYILFFEDVDEDIQHIHRYLTILKHMGVLDQASGIVFGEWTDMPPNRGDYFGNSRGGMFASVADMTTKQIVGDLDIPIAFGFPAGHGEVNYPLLMGVEAHLSVSADNFTLDWEER